MQQEDETWNMELQACTTDAFKVVVVSSYMVLACSQAGSRLRPPKRHNHVPLSAHLYIHSTTHQPRAGLKSNMVRPQDQGLTACSIVNAQYTKAAIIRDSMLARGKPVGENPPHGATRGVRSRDLIEMNRRAYHWTTRVTYK